MSVARPLAMLLLAVLSADIVDGYPGDYGPFEPGQQPNALPVAHCPIVGQRGAPAPFGQDYRPPEIIYGRARGGGPRLHAIATIDSYPPAIEVATGFAMTDHPDPDRRHSYWVYHLLAIHGDELIVDDDVDPRFPKWVWYTSGPNHKPSRRLTATDKARIWSQQPQPILREVPAP